MTTSRFFMVKIIFSVTIHFQRNIIIQFEFITIKCLSKIIFFFTDFYRNNFLFLNSTIISKCYITKKNILLNILMYKNYYSIQYLIIYRYLKFIWTE
jgi:hypothetical protein